jgi:CSLREA domain-containing protein
VLCLLVCLALTCHADLSSALVFTVDSTSDEVDAAPGHGLCATAGGACTLRAAIQESNALAGPHDILLPAGTYTLAIVGAGEELSATGDLDIQKPGGSFITLLGDGERVTVIDAGAIDRAIDVVAGTASISGVTIRNGSAADGGGVAVGEAGTLIIDNATITANTATNEGGGVDNKGSLTLVRVTISGNTGQTGGGGLSNNLAGFAALSEVIISTNTAGGDGGGGIDNKGDLSIDMGTLSANGGRALTNSGTLFLQNVTISGNTADAAAGISNDGVMDLVNVTVTGNTAAAAPGGIRNAVGASASLVNTIIAGNSPLNCVMSGTVTSLGGNIDSGATCGLAGTADLADTNPTLGPLQDNGGYAPSHALLTGSPAIDSGDDAACLSVAVDARNFPRPLDGNGTGVPAAVCDRGAYELCRAVFNDVTPGSTFDVYIQGLSCNQITTGCTPSGTSYCPANNMTRQAMAAFIIRAIFGEDFHFTQTPYFSDVPGSNQFFKYIQRMKDEAFTTGCDEAGTLYCPSGIVNRKQTAAFIGRSFLSIP